MAAIRWIAISKAPITSDCTTSVLASRSTIKVALILICTIVIKQYVMKQCTLNNTQKIMTHQQQMEDQGAGQGPGGSNPPPSSTTNTTRAAPATGRDAANPTTSATSAADRPGPGPRMPRCEIEPPDPLLEIMSCTPTVFKDYANTLRQTRAELAVPPSNFYQHSIANRASILTDGCRQGMQQSE